MTRKEFLFGGAALAGASALARPVRSLVGSNGESYVDSAMPTASDYVQEGLVGMFDGVENIDWDIHSEDTLVWKDLIGGVGDLSLAGEHLSVLDNAVWWDGQHISRYRPCTWMSDAGRFTIQKCEYMSAATDGRGVGTVKLRDNSTGQVYSLFDTYRQSEDPTRLQSYFPWPSGLKGYPRREYTTLSFIGGGGNYTVYDGNHQVLSNVSCGAIGANMQFRFWWPSSQASTNGNIRTYCIRVYDRELSGDEIAHNVLIDKRRFGI